ncbi:metallophosphoesterase family protein [Luteimonas sp. A478]
MVKIAVISDLHVGEVARSPELNPFTDTPADGFLASFEAFVHNAGIEADLLIVPGDISDKAHPEEYRLAADVIRRVASALNVDHDKVYPVLGNHDLNWALINAIEGAGSFGLGLRFEAVKSSDWLNSRLTSSTEGTQTESPYLCIDETDEAFIVRYNSAEADLPSVRPHRGAIQQEHLEVLQEKLRGAMPPEDKVRLFVTHHHPQIYSDPIADYPDFSALVNAENLLDLLREFNFDLVVHGHKHVPKFSSSVQSGRRALSILCAGSFSRSISTAWTGVVTNQFHMIETSNRDAETGYLRGEVKSWAYQPRAWVPSNRQWAGIRHLSRFGSYQSNAQLTACIQSTLGPELLQRSLEWNDIVQLLPELEFTDVDVLIEALNTFVANNSAILRLDNDDPSTILLVRR